MKKKNINTVLADLKATVQLLERVALYRELSDLEQAAKDNQRRSREAVSLEEDMARS